MKETIQSLLPWLVLVSHLVFAYILLAFLFRKSWGQETIAWVRKRSIFLGIVISLAAILGSLFYSNTLGYAPCDLCWWQRVFLYPPLVLFVVALQKRDRAVFDYVLPLSVIAMIISIYNIFVQTTGNQFIPCSASATCTKVYVMAFNYVTIPTMALTVGAYLLLLSLISKKYE
jgi:disulfide bond formation protein DsbB